MLALALADTADTVTTARFRAADLVVETKPDLTPVSEADRDAEQAIREHVARERPNDVVLGEEYGTTGTGPRRWIGLAQSWFRGLLVLRAGCRRRGRHRVRTRSVVVGSRPAAVARRRSRWDVHGSLGGTPSRRRQCPRDQWSAARCSSGLAHVMRRRTTESQLSMRGAKASAAASTH